MLDRRGTYLAFGGNPAKVGTLVQDIPGIDGQSLVDDIFKQARALPSGLTGVPIAFVPCPCQGGFNHRPYWGIRTQLISNCYIVNSY